MRCPVCRAELTTGPQCRRCRADLSLHFELEERRTELLTRAEAHLARGEGGEVVDLAYQAGALRVGDDARRLRALGHLLLHEFPLAWQSYLALSGAKSEG